MGCGHTGPKHGQTSQGCHSSVPEMYWIWIITINWPLQKFCHINIETKWVLKCGHLMKIGDYIPILVHFNVFDDFKGKNYFFHSRQRFVFIHLFWNLPPVQGEERSIHRDIPGLRYLPSPVTRWPGVSMSSIVTLTQQTGLGEGNSPVLQPLDAWVSKIVSQGLTWLVFEPSLISPLKSTNIYTRIIDLHDNFYW